MLNPVVHAIFIAAGGLCPGVTVVERLSAPVAGSRLVGTANYNDMVRHGIREMSNGTLVLFVIRFTNATLFAMVSTVRRVLFERETKMPSSSNQ
jgi:hypothetical protein